MLASVHSAVLEGVDGRVVTRRGPRLRRPARATRWSACPTRPGASRASASGAALLSSGLAFPIKRVTVNLAPASIRKAGSGLELAIALALTSADGGLPAGVLDGVAVLGELGLDGAVRPVAGTLALVDARRARRRGVRDRSRAPTRPRPRSFPACTCGTRGSLGELLACLKGEAPWPDPPDPTRRRRRRHRRRRAARPRRRARPRQRAPRALGRGRRRSPPAARRPARRRQDHARPPPADDHARRSNATPRSKSRASTRRRVAARVSTLQTARAVPRAAPQRIERRARRRRQPARAPRRDHARASRRALPRRAARVPDQRARRAAPTARGTRGAHQPGVGNARVPCRLPARRVRQPVPVRAQRRWSAAAATRNACGTRGGFRHRSSTASISGSGSTRPGTEAGRIVGGDAHARRRARSSANARGSRAPAGDATRTFHPARSSALVPLAARRARGVARCVPPAPADRPRRGAGPAGRAHVRRSRRSRDASPPTTSCARAWLREDVW